MPPIPSHPPCAAPAPAGGKRLCAALREVSELVPALLDRVMVLLGLGLGPGRARGPQGPGPASGAELEALAGKLQVAGRNGTAEWSMASALRRWVGGRAGGGRAGRRGRAGGQGAGAIPALAAAIQGARRWPRHPHACESRPDAPASLTWCPPPPPPFRPAALACPATTPTGACWAPQCTAPSCWPSPPRRACGSAACATSACWARWRPTRRATRALRCWLRSLRPSGRAWLVGVAPAHVPRGCVLIYA